MNFLAFLAAISGSNLVNGLIYLLIMGIICWLLLWLVGMSPIPEPFKKVITWIIYVVAVLMLINWLLSLTGNAVIVF